MADKLITVQFLLSSNYREIDLNGIQGDNSKIIREIGWKPTYTLDQICSKMILYD